MAYEELPFSGQVLGGREEGSKLPWGVPQLHNSAQTLNFEMGEFTKTAGA